MTSRFWRHAVTIRRSFSLALLGLGASIVPGPAFAEDAAGPFDSDDAVTVPSARAAVKATAPAPAAASRR